MLFIVLECVLLGTSKKKNLTTTDYLDRHRMLQYTVLKGNLFFRPHDVSVIRLASHLKTQQFVPAPVVRKSLVALR